MTTVTGSNSIYDATYLDELSVAALGAHSATQFVLTIDGYTVTVTGTGFTYSGNGPSGGTITGMSVLVPNDTAATVWSDLNVSASTLWTAVRSSNAAAFNALLYGGDDTFVCAKTNVFGGGAFSGFGGNDTFNMQTSTSVDFLNGGDGNDTFNYLGNLRGMTVIDGGTGTDTINLDGDYSAFQGYGLLGYVTNVEVVNLAAGHSYYIGGAISTPMTFNAASLAAANGVTIDLSGATAGGTLNAGAGNDTLIDGFGNDVFNGGAGTDTVDYSHATGAITVNLSLSTAQTIGGGMGTDTLVSVENIIASRSGGTYVGSADDNLFQLGASTASTTIDGGDGADMVWFNVPLPVTNDTAGITVDLRGAAPKVTGVCGNVTLTNVESIKGTCRGDTFIGNAADNVFDSGGSADWRYLDVTDYSAATGGMSFTVSAADPNRITATGGGQGTDTLIGMQKIVATAYDDTITTVAGTNLVIDGGAGTDTLVLPGNLADYRITTYTDGTASITLGPGGQLSSSITIAGIERVSFADQTWVFQLSGTAGNDALIGTSKDDIFDLSQGGDDTASGLAGDDIFRFGAAFTAADRVDGGAGSDTVIVAATGTQTLQLGASTLTNVENLRLSGAAYNLTMNDANVAAASTLSIDASAALSFVFDGSAERDGNFSITCPGATTTVIGGGGNDRITANIYVKAATISGGGGNDYIDGTYYDDTLNGDAGNDTIRDYGGDHNIVSGGAGNDTVIDCWGTINGGAGLDTASYSAVRRNMGLTHNADGSYTLTNLTLNMATTTLIGFEKVRFADQTVTIGTPAANDFSGTGNSAILWQNDNGTAAIWTMNGFTQTDGSPVGGNPGPTWHVAGSGDFFGDGSADILWQNDDGSTVLWTMNGLTQTGSAYVGSNPGASWHVKGTGDFNGDGKADILWQNDNGQAAIWEMDGAYVLGGSTVGGNPGTSWHIVGNGDFNGDGNADILWQSDSGQAVVWTMNGFAQTGSAYVGGNPGPSWHIKGVGDFYGTGQANILWQNDNGQAAIWTMNGTAQQSSDFVGGNPGTDWHIVGTGDYNGDGKADILWQNNNGQAAVWTMNGVTQLGGSLVGGNPGTSWHIPAGVG